MKLQVVLIDSESRFRDLNLTDLRSQEGPFPSRFFGQRYYDPREDSEILALARTDQIIALDTIRRFNQDCDDYLAAGGDGLCLEGKTIPYYAPVPRPWEAVLYSGFAEHFILTYIPVAYPRWYIDSIGALFSTIDAKDNGKMDYAQPPSGYKDIFRSYRYPNVGEILTGRYLDLAPDESRWSPYGVWLLAHYFLYSNLKSERRRQFEQYMAAIRQGTPMTDAAKIFGDMRKLQREVTAYAETDISFAHTDAPQGNGGDPLVSALPADTGSAEPDWLARVRSKVVQLPYDADAILFVAEA